MRNLGRYWIALLAVLLLVGAVGVYLLLYLPARREFESNQDSINTQIAVSQMSIEQNGKYVELQDQIEMEREKLLESRQALYDQFPTELKEEDQILFFLELEEKFGTQITYSLSSERPMAILGFGTRWPLAVLRDGAVVDGLSLTFNFTTSYQGFKDMVDYLAKDARILSVRYASISYDYRTDTLGGTMTIRRYQLDTPMLEYTEPQVPEPDVIGKPNFYN